MKYAILAVFSLLFACSTAPQRVIYFKMDTFVELTVYEKGDLSGIFENLEAFIDGWEEKYSPSGLEIYNNRSSDTLLIDDNLYEMVETSLIYGEKLDGYFDITVRPLKDFWDIESRGDFLPDPADEGIADSLREVLSAVDYRQVRLLEDPKRIVFGNSGVKIDLGAVAKGFAVCRMKDTLHHYGYNNFIINVGGDIFISGTNFGGKPIVAGIRDPRNPQDGVVLQSFAMTGALFTSGNYERFRLAESGIRVHHIFDVKTGFPAGENISITVRGDCPIVADILATGLFALPADKIHEKVKDFEGYEVYLLSNDQ